MKKVHVSLIAIVAGVVTLAIAVGILIPALSKNGPSKAASTSTNLNPGTVTTNQTTSHVDDDGSNNVESGSTQNDDAGLESKHESTKPGVTGTPKQLIVSKLSCPKEAGQFIEFTLRDLLTDADVSVQISKKNSDLRQSLVYSLELANSNADTLCTLVRVSSDGKDQFIQPMARSYSGHNWEVTAGKYVSQLNFHCPQYPGQPSSACFLDLDMSKLKDLTDATFHLTTFGRPAYTERDMIARFLEQTTFGPTSQEIEQLADASGGEFTVNTLMTRFANWIKEQQENTPMMSHRAIYRSRMNARYEFPTEMSDITSPCQVGARYRRDAFSEKDNGKLIDLTNVTNDKVMLSVDGEVRTIVGYPILYWDAETKSGQPFLTEGPIEIWRVSYEDRGRTIIRTRDDTGKLILLQFQETNTLAHDGNPKIRTNPSVDSLSSIPPEMKYTTLDIPLESARPIDEHLYQFGMVPENNEIILTASLSSEQCNFVQATNQDQTTVFAVWNGAYYIHDPRFRLQHNPKESPLIDGGGTIASITDNLLGGSDNTQCSNAPRTFLNENECFLSNHPQACPFMISKPEYLLPEAYFEVSHENLRAIYEASVARGHGAVHFYAIEGLDINRDPSVKGPCVPGKTRWIPVPCSNSDQIRNQTKDHLEKRISHWARKNLNPHILDMTVPPHVTSDYCDPADEVEKGFEIKNILRDDNYCWKNVHPDHLNVYDFTEWASTHPGNSDTRNPISEPGDLFGNTTLVFPEWHEMSRWTGQKRLLPGPLILGDTVNFYILPAEIRTTEVADALGIQVEADAEEMRAGSTVVCGSPFEIANNPALGGRTGQGSFDAFTTTSRTTGNYFYALQRETVWISAALQDSGQLRQRVAWALSQIFAISPESIDTLPTEEYLVFYDIMVRNAFGNYRDLLREVSYSSVMAEMLTYYGSRSTEASRIGNNNIQFADENYAREVMQLFTTGSIKLHKNGTEALDASSVQQKVYSNDDIEEYARAWTGFVNQASRGNFETRSNKNRVDPMRPLEQWRDRLPKMGLNGKYIGDGYPLCADLPRRHFLEKGATYQLLGSTPDPEQVRDPGAWINDDSVERLSLDRSSALYKKLCSASEDGSSCTLPMKVVLDETLTCFGQECPIDSIRTVEVEGLFYEYLRPKCVHQAFYNDAKTLVHRRFGITTMCGDPRIEAATTACCGPGNTTTDRWEEQYFGERVRFSTAFVRCAESMCARWRRPSCDDDRAQVISRCQDGIHYWTNQPCTLLAKIDILNGKVGIVHKPPENVPDTHVASTVSSQHVQTFFRVQWDGDFSLLTSCNDIPSCRQSDDDETKCICEVSVIDEIAFENIPTRQEILDQLHIGAFHPSTSFDAYSAAGVTVYNTGQDGSLSLDSIFEVVDDFGKLQRRKNIKSTVYIVGTQISFRNPVHFVSLWNSQPHELHAETEATLDHYFYHTNTAPFVAIRYAQRFGISNPSPRYIEEITKAFTTGLYSFEDSGQPTTFGSGSYGDLAATFACILLDREARDVLLDNDPSHGALKEPLIKVLSVFRTFQYQGSDKYPQLQLTSGIGSRIGQMAHQIPSVFSFFLPEYQPLGPISQGSLVAPEAQVLTGPKAIQTLNGIFSLLKYGLHNCFEGFGQRVYHRCDLLNLETTLEKAAGFLSFEPGTAKSVNKTALVDELALLMTAGRLSVDRRQLIENVIRDDDAESALRKGQMLVAASPEFHSTNLVRQNSQQRPSKPPPIPSDKPYKALVYVFLQGGADSHNMLAPHTCRTTNEDGLTLLEQYNEERADLALTEEERTRIIQTTGQACEEFAIHPDLPLVERLFHEGELSFFANVGQLDAPVTKRNYVDVTRTQLFAHNKMQYQAQRVDPWSAVQGTGILGRMCDTLLGLGYNCQAITVEDATVATRGGGKGTENSTLPLIVSPNGPTKFAPTFFNDTFDVNDYIDQLNSGSQLQSSMFGETWSRVLHQGIQDSNFETDLLDNLFLTQNYTLPDDPKGEADFMNKIRALVGQILTYQSREADRDVFFVQFGTWDHHARLKESLSTQCQRLDAALTSLEQELKAHGLWNQVTVMTASDFGRTLTGNSGSGSDHAWAGNYFMMGGSVKGRQIHGQYPSDISSKTSPLNLGRGRLIPTLSWESMLNSAVQWMGVTSDDDLDYCLPNRHNSGAELFTMEQVFQQEAQERSSSNPNNDGTRRNLRQP